MSTHLTGISDEKWKPVAGWEGLYEVSNKGRVRSLEKVIVRRDGFKTRKAGKFLSLDSREGTWYPRVMLREGDRNREELVHRLVAEAFIPNPDDLPLVRHLNDIKSDNRVENLAWGTHSDNMADSIRNGKQSNQHRGKTHCLRGHPFDENNTRIVELGRGCKACSRERAREKRAKGLPEGDPKHGTRTGYGNFGCRCDDCKGAMGFGPKGGK